ncbi:MAG: rRNA maturation RNase YbeY [Clostridia bacterium]|nr:rRNA maturation RNase YbeY [Clostridia bacterium]
MMIYFENDQEKMPISYKLKKLVRFAVEATLAYEEIARDLEVSVTFTDDEGIRKLNRNFRKIDRATDVLSFPLFDFEGDGDALADELDDMLGDIVLSLERAVAQAEEYGHSFEREVAFLTVHSMLHLLGYDHETSEEDELDMRRRQTAIMEMLGLAVK